MITRGKKFSVLGAGRSGIAAARLLRKRRARVFLSDDAPLEKSHEAATKLSEIGVEYEFGGNTHRVLEADTIVVSPGVPQTVPILILARERGIKVISEIELASEFCEVPIAAITGTNGKTTTTTLLGEIFKQAGWNVAVAGNIGLPFSDVVESLQGEKSVAVLEVSSFQLDTIDRFRPKVAVLLNVTPDHLDRYPSFEAYVQAKFRIAENQKGHDTFIFNADDEIVRNFAETVNVRTLGFSLTSELKQGASLQDGNIVLRIGRDQQVLMPKQSVGIPGPHNLMNAMAAALVARAFGIEPAVIRTALETFQGVEHRIEFVREHKGVRYYNDSKATNVDSLYYALGSFEHRPIVLIAGGKDKGNDYARVAQLVQEHVRAIVTVGKGAKKIESYFAGKKPILSAGFSMEEAVKLAAGVAEQGDVVLLSPACASFDMFDNYEHRGRVFKELVHQL